MANENANPTTGGAGQPQQGPAVPPQPAPVQPQPATTTPVQPVAPVQAAQPAPQAVPQAIVQPAAQPMPQPVAQPTPVQPAPQPIPQPATPTPQPVAQPQAAPQYRPVQPVQQLRPGMPGQPVMGQPGQQLQPGQIRPGTTTRKPPNPKKLIGGCLGCFGGALILFIVLVLVFVSQTSAAGENPLAKSLGMDAATFINTLITVVNLVFGSIAVGLFLLAIIGLFRFAMARKDDKESRKKGLTLAGASGGILLLILMIWIGIYAFMSSRKAPVQKASIQTGIITDPVNILQQVAPFQVTFTAPTSLIDTNKYDILSFAWNFGDGTTGSSKTESHLYNKDGRYDVTLEISKKNKQTKEETVDKFTTTITISKILNPDFTATPSTGPAPLEVSFDASASSTSSGKIAAYDWDFTGGNNFGDASGVTVTHTFTQVGTYKVGLRISDQETPPNSRTITKEVVVQGSNIPTAVIDIPTTDGKYYSGIQYTFLGDKSTSPTGKIVKYSWDFGDGSPKANTRTANHTYKLAGEYDVSLSVTDDNAMEAQATQHLKVEQASSAPIAAITTVPGPASDKDNFISGTVPFEVSFDASRTQDPDKNIIEYKWDFDGDGTYDQSGEKVTYAYKKDGVYNAKLTVIDADNNESNATVVVKVGSQPLQARVTADPVEGVAPLTIKFDASGSTYPSGKIVSFEWDFGDGTPKRIDVAQVTHKYTNIGTFTVKVTAIASDNSKSTVEMPVNVRPVPLTACFEATPEQGQAPLEIEFDPSCSTGTVAKYSWDFGDNQTSRTRKPKHTFTQPGSYTITLEVSDNQNVINTFTKNILITGSVN